MVYDVWLYIKAIAVFTTKGTCSALSEMLGNTSHDRLNRVLTGNWSGQKLLEIALRLLFTVVGGYLIIDDTVIDKPFSKRIQGLSFVYDSSKKKTVFGYSVVILIWTDGQIRIPIAFRLWQKGGLSKFSLALEMLSYARNRLKLKPDFVLFDSWYASKKLLKRIRDYGWYFVTRLKKNRLLDGQQIKQLKKHPYWREIGCLTGAVKVVVVRNGKKYYCTNRLTLTRKEILSHYSIRQSIEEVIKVLKSKLMIKDCQSISRVAQEHHFALCMTAYIVLQRESKEKRITIYKLKLRLNAKRDAIPMHHLERLRDAA